MIETTFADQRNPYDEAIKFLRIPEVNESKHPEKGLRNLKVEVESNRTVYHKGERSKEFLNLLATRQILSVTNFLEEQAETTPVENKLLTGVKLPTHSAKVKATPKEKAPIKESYNLGDVVMADFGRPRGAEFGHPHPAIVYDSPAEGLYNVIPCSTKYREGKEVLEIALSDPRVLKDADEIFMNKSKNQKSYALFREKQPISVSRFIRYLGRIDESYIEQIERCYVRTTDEDPDRPFTVADLKLTEKQLRMIEKDSEQILEIGNSEDSYESKVRKILIRLGIYPEVTKEASYLEEAIINAKVIKNFEIRQLAKDVAKGKPISSDVMHQKINDAVRKRFKQLGPCTEEFINLVNKVAYYR